MLVVLMWIWNLYYNVFMGWLLRFRDKCRDKIRQRCKNAYMDFPIAAYMLWSPIERWMLFEISIINHKICPRKAKAEFLMIQYAVFQCRIWDLHFPFKPKIRKHYITQTMKTDPRTPKNPQVLKNIRLVVFEIRSEMAALPSSGLAKWHMLKNLCFQGVLRCRSKPLVFQTEHGSTNLIRLVTHMIGDQFLMRSVSFIDILPRFVPTTLPLFLLKRVCPDLTHLVLIGKWPLQLTCQNHDVLIF